MQTKFEERCRRPKFPIFRISSEFALKTYVYIIGDVCVLKYGLGMKRGVLYRKKAKYQESGIFNKDKGITGTVLALNAEMSREPTTMKTMNKPKKKKPSCYPSL
jgi:hypothetical protein